MGIVILDRARGSIKRLLYIGSKKQMEDVELLVNGKTRGDRCVSFPPVVELIDKVIDKHPDTTLEEALVSWRNEEYLRGGLISEALYMPRLDIEGLRQYQNQAVNALMIAKKVVLGDDRGIGKTIEALATAEFLRESLQYATFVICPAYLIDKWYKEAIKWTKYDVVKIQGTKQQKLQAIVDATAHGPKGLLLIMSYETTITHHYGDIYKIPRSILIVDEAHRLGNRKNKSVDDGDHNGVLNLAFKSEYTWLLTGTVVAETNPSKLWSLLHILDPVTFSSYWWFIDRYCITVEDAYGYTLFKGGKNTEELASILNRYYIKRKREEVMEEIPVCEDIIYVEMSPLHKKLYNELVKNSLCKMHSNVLLHNTVTTLRKFAQYPAAFGCEDKRPKSDVILKLVEDCMIEGQKILIFGWHKDYLATLYREINVNYAKSVMVNGDTPIILRTQVVDKFNEGEYEILLGTMGSIGEGLDIQIADVIIFAELHWNPCVVDQAISRVVRMGRQAPVAIYKVITRDTIEETILEINEQKEKYIDEVNALLLLRRSLDKEASDNV